jgi:membrane protease YdiL (CAAX protease family)
MIAIVGFVVVERRAPRPGDLGLAGTDVPLDARDRRRTIAGRGIRAAWLALTLASVVGGRSLSTYEESATSVGIGVLAGIVLLRWPIAVLAQQVLFFGWLQPRLGRYGPLLAAVLYTAYHVTSDNSLLNIAPLGAIFALTRWQTGGIRAGLAIHYAINVVLYVLSTR